MITPFHCSSGPLIVFITDSPLKEPSKAQGITRCASVQPAQRHFFFHSAEYNRQREKTIKGEKGRYRLQCVRSKDVLYECENRFKQERVCNIFEISSKKSLVIRYFVITIFSMLNAV